MNPTITLLTAYSIHVLSDTVTEHSTHKSETLSESEISTVFTYKKLIKSKR